MIYVLGYMVLINLISFVAMGIDKRKARHARWRLAETTLLYLAGVGGFLGVLGGMTVFHHKTRKSSFLWKYRLVTAGWIVLVLMMVIYDIWPL